jgi:hypothetical protein
MPSHPPLNALLVLQAPCAPEHTQLHYVPVASNSIDTSCVSDNHHYEPRAWPQLVSSMPGSRANGGPQRPLTSGRSLASSVCRRGGRKVAPNFV